MSNGAEIQLLIAEKKGQYVRKDGLAELTFSIASETLWIADHTEVDESLKGTGAGVALVERLVQDAVEAGRKIIPLCPFVNAQRRKHPEWADAFQV